MRRMLVLVTLLAGVLFLVTNYHVILTSSTLMIERKAELSFAEAFVDTRAWGPLDYARHPGIAAILIRRGLADAIEGGGPDDAIERAADTARGIKDKLDQAVERAQQR